MPCYILIQLNSRFTFKRILFNIYMGRHSGVWSLHVLLVSAWSFPPTITNVSSCLSLCVGPVTLCTPMPGCSANASWDRLQHPRDPLKDKWYRKWMDGCLTYAEPQQHVGIIQ